MSEPKRAMKLPELGLCSEGQALRAEDFEAFGNVRPKIRYGEARGVMTLLAEAVKVVSYCITPFLNFTSIRNRMR